MQCNFGSDHTLGTTQHALTYNAFISTNKTNQNIYRPMKWHSCSNSHGFASTNANLI